MLHRASFFLALALACTQAFAQRNIWAGHVLDAETRVGIHGVNISSLDGSTGTVTDADGAFHAMWSGDDVQLRFSHVSYEERTLPARASDTMAVVLLSRRSVEIPVVEITVPVPELVFEHPTLQVATFRINAEGLWVLAYGKRRMVLEEAAAGQRIYRDVELFLLDTSFALRARSTVPGEARGLHLGRNGEVYLETTRAAHALRFEDDSISWTTLRLNDLFGGILPWTDSVPGRLIGSDHTPDFPAFDHFGYDPSRRSVNVFCSIVDEHLMALYRSQYKYMSGREKVIAMDLERTTGVDKELIAGRMTGFANDPYFHALYAPLMRVGDSLLVFDHHAGRIRCFDTDIKAMGEVSITYQLRRDWEKELIQDRTTQRIYAVFQRNGEQELVRVDPGTGGTREAHRLQQRYPQQVQVHDGAVYYVHRPFGSLRTLALYRETLP